MKRFSLFMLFLCLVIYSAQLNAQTYKILFDNSKSQTAGNADWKIDDNEPTVLPASPSSEADWIGGISAWGYDLWVTGNYSITQLPAGETISYGDSTNPLDLQYFDVFVICEPNNLFSTSEKEALIAFVENGGGLFLVGDHDGSDRDGDGSDSVDVLNDLFNNNPRNITNIFGITINYNSVSGSYTDINTNLSDPVDFALFNGPFGSVTGIAYHSGGTLTVNPSANPKAKGHIWTSSNKLNSEVVLATSEFGLGRIAVVGDSSPADDGTGQPGDRLYNGWNETGVTDREIFLNLTKWLAEAGGSGNGISISQIQLNPTTPTANTDITVSATITDDTSIASATMYYKTFSENNYSFVAMSNTVNNTFEATIPGMNNTIVQYYIEAKDNENNKSVSPVNSYQVGIIPICNLRQNDVSGANKFNGMKVTVTGVVTAPTLNCFGSQNQTNIYIQDSSGCGINIYNNTTDLPNVVVGDIVKVTGFITQNKGNLEILTSSPNASIEVIGSQTEPNPIIITCSEINEANEGKLVRINGVTTSSSIPASGVSGPMTITDATGSATLYIDKDSLIDGTQTPSGTFDIIGIIGQYDTSSPYTEGYQLYPRFVSDFIQQGQATTYQLTTSIGSGNGQVTPTGTNTYDENALVTITATANTGYEFDHWSGDISGTTNPVTVTMSSNLTIYANFKQVNNPPSTTNGGLIISEYIEGSSTNKALEFTNLSGGSIDLATEQYKVEIYANGATTPTNTINLQGTIENNSTFVLATTLLSQYANQVSDLVSFNGDDAVVLKKGDTVVDSIGQVGVDPGSAWVSGSVSTKNMTLRRKANIVKGDAVTNDSFDPASEWDAFPQDTFDDLGSYGTINTVQLTTTVIQGEGTVEPFGTNTYNIGEAVTITATPTTNYTFNAFSGDVVSNVNPLTITLNSDTNISVSFKLITYQLTTLVAEGAGTVTPAGTNNYTINSIVTITATPDAGYAFSHWSGAITSTNPTISVTIDSDKEISAHFIKDMPQTQSHLVLNEFLADPYGAGDANGDGVVSGTGDEFIELVNNSDNPLDISGYQIFDNTNLRFTFPANTVIPAHECCVVFAAGSPTGDFGNATANNLVFVTYDGGGNGILGMDNSSDTIIVKDSSGNTVIDYSYSSIKADISQTRVPDITGDFQIHPKNLKFSPGFMNDGVTSFTTTNNVVNDFNKDGYTDILLTNYFDGSNTVFYMNGINKIQETTIVNTPLDYKVVGTGDFNKDGYPDIVLKNVYDNSCLVYFLANNQKQSEEYLDIPSKLSLVGVGDFNKDKNPDLVLRNTNTRQTVIWYLKGLTKVSTAILPYYNYLWEIQQITDLNNDGKLDIVLHNSLFAMSKVIYLDNYAKLNEDYLPNLPYGWNYVGSGDFNNDGKTDLLIQDWFSGKAYVLYMNGGKELGYDSLPFIGYEWEIVN